MSAKFPGGGGVGGYDHLAGSLIFHDGLRRETCSDTRITLAQYPIILAGYSVHFANFLRFFYAAE